MLWYLPGTEHLLMRDIHSPHFKDEGNEESKRLISLFLGLREQVAGSKLSFLK